MRVTDADRLRGMLVAAGLDLMRSSSGRPGGAEPDFFAEVKHLLGEGAVV